MKPSILGPRVAPTTLAFTTAPSSWARRGVHGLAVDDEDGRELDLAAVVDTEALDLELLTGFDLVLLAAGADHCVHGAGNPSNTCAEPR